MTTLTLDYPIQQSAFNPSLSLLLEAVVRDKCITEDSVNTLQRYLLKDGINTREEADSLIALDRAVHARWWILWCGQAAPQDM
jgi:hypothetical protein